MARLMAPATGIIVVLVCVFVIFVTFKRIFCCRLLTGRLSEVEKVKIAYYRTKPYPNAAKTIILTPEKDKDLISTLYKRIGLTPTCVAGEQEETINRGYSDEPLPFFQIEFFYSNRESDRINSCESGTKILRHTSSCIDWYEGSSKHVLSLVKKALE